jgi:hypothetical protein
MPEIKVSHGMSRNELLENRGRVVPYAQCAGTWYPWSRARETSTCRSTDSSNFLANSADEADNRS